MKYVKQLMLILSITLIGELLHVLLPLPVPAGIYGLVLLFLALQTGILKVDSIKETAEFLLQIMPIFFIPAGVALMTVWVDLKPILFPLLATIIVSTVAVMVVSGKVTQFLIRHKKKEVKHE